MRHERLFQARQNRLVAVVRVVLAAFALIAVAVDPRGSRPADIAVFDILCGYLAVSLGVVGLTHVWKRRTGDLFLPTFTLDFLVFAAVILLTGGSTSPFFPLLLLSATLHWGWRGALGITAAVLALFIPTAAEIFQRFNGAATDPQRFIIRIGNLIALGVTMIVLVRYQDRVSRDLMRMSDAKLQPEAADLPPVMACLGHALSVFSLNHGVFVWGEPEEPDLNISEIRGGLPSLGRWPTSSDEAHPLLDVIGEPFLFDPQGPAAAFLGRDGRMARAPLEVLTNPVLSRFAQARTLVIPVTASSFAGWIMLPEFQDLDRESLALAATVAAQATVAIESWRSLMTWRDAKAAEERVRLARDLHDGTLQFLAGAAMQLESLARAVEPERMEQTRAEIRRLRDDLQAEQRQLRELISSTSTSGVRAQAKAFDVEVRELAAVLARRWNTEISVVAEPGEGVVPAALAFEMLQIVREAISNAVRHGAASTVKIRAERRHDDLVMAIIDNGVGMPTPGRFGMEELLAQSLGPKMLRARIAELGGDLSIDTSSSGTSLQIIVPAEPPSAPA